jgi:hypothetical protein
LNTQDAMPPRKEMSSSTTSAFSLGFTLSLGLVSSIAAGVGKAPSIEEFASRSQVEDVTISPDGRYLAVIQTHSGRAAVVVIDRTAPAAPQHRFVAVPDADHSFSAEKDRVTLLREIEAFLADHLGTGVP